MFSVNYVNPNKELVFDQRQSGPGNTKLTQAIDTRVIEINDVRKREKNFTLDVQGFKPVYFDLEFDNFEDDQALVSNLYPRVQAFISHTLGVKDSVIFDHTYRSSTRKTKTVHNRAPVKTVHNDYTKSSAKRMFDLQTQDRPDLRGKPYQFINLWLPVNNEVEESPLAFIDLSTVESADFRKLKLIYPDRIGEISGIAYNPKHSWFYKSLMKPGEGMLFKVFDSESKNNIVGVPHSAVDLLEVEESNVVNKRSSIEFRAIVFGE
ncbi:CmcJ/NvfI family oxidoreductase [Pseudoalteromonas rubra]|uniref:Methyltransferase n=1 Tax=Pseudoalteromonas rubra TaxID=43658 RepID=A0A0U3HPQ4_9GAMM|nr:CmcJ/NvfI family oxidoreductase [Pseudoalteromonas rubra]ALU44901.1 hypothetical protein AT705_19250 [Pseudoalteromonas rubra]